MEKLIIVVMGQDAWKFLPMCLESVKDADAIIYCDGGSYRAQIKYTDLCRKIGIEEDKIEFIQNEYDQEDKEMNGKQRNFYLKYIKENYPDDWCLALDADEVVENFSEFKEFIQTAEPGIYSPRMRHFIGDLGNEDAIQKIHIVLNRLFKISEAKEYPLREHPTLIGNYPVGSEPKYFHWYGGMIWHLAYCPNIWDYKKRYENHLKKSQMHTPEYLKNWYYSHLFGKYPRSAVNPVEIPKVILDEFNVDKDEIYFSQRNLELKHFVDAIHWKEFFKCKTAIEFGCGKGPRVYAMNQIGIDAYGADKSEFAIKHGYQIDKMELYDVTEDMKFKEYDLVICYDLLEHIPYNKLDKVINNIIGNTKKFVLISVPFKGTSNCEMDPTHIIKEDKEWWINRLESHRLKQIETPNHFLYKEQILIFSK